MKETIIQFGEGNFLRGFADLFIHKLNEQGLYDGKVVVVQPIKTGLCDVLNEQKGVYNLYLRGLQNGEAVCEHTRVTSISRAVNPYADFEGFLALAKDPDFRFVISNTTEAGIAYDPSCAVSDRPASSFPGKLTQLLYARFQAGLPGFVMLACELIDNNGKALQSCVLRYAQQWKLGEAFYEWVIRENNFCSTLVDRIVTGYPKAEAAALCQELGWEDRLLDTAEPYHLWVIEGDCEAELPLRRAGVNVVWTNDVSPYKKRKVRVLNGAHTAMVFPALLCGLKTVGEALRDEQVSGFLNKALFSYILPALGDTEDNRAFAYDVLERFRNPYIQHQLRSIALNSVSKFSVRVLPTMLDCREKDGVFPRPLTLSLAALLHFYKTDAPQDDAAAITCIRERTLPEILRDTALWGTDLTELAPEVSKGMEIIEKQGMREAITWALS